MQNLAAAGISNSLLHAASISFFFWAVGSLSFRVKKDENLKLFNNLLNQLLCVNTYSSDVLMVSHSRLACSLCLQILQYTSGCTVTPNNLSALRQFMGIWVVKVLLNVSHIPNNLVVLNLVV